MFGYHEKKKKPEEEKPRFTVIFPLVFRCSGPFYVNLLSCILLLTFGRRPYRFGGPDRVYGGYEYFRMDFRAPFPVGGLDHVVVDVPAETGRGGGHGCVGRSRADSVPDGTTGCTARA